MWQEENKQLTKRFSFKDFKEAFAFITEVATLAETLNHHPEWTNNYNNVWFRLYTIDAGNIITDQDRQLAEGIDKIAEKY